VKYKFIRQTPLFSKRAQYKSIGYARQSSNKKISITAQIEELKNAGCLDVFQEKEVRNTNKCFTSFNSVLETLKKGDEIVLTKIDRGFRNPKIFINTLNDLQKKGIHIRTTDGIINTRALGKYAPLVIGLLFGMVEIERQMVIERAYNSVNHGKETLGNLGGRPKTNKEKETLVIRLRSEGCSYRSIRKQTGLALSTIRRIIVERETTES